MRHDRQRLVVLTVLMAAVAVTVTVIALAILYRANLTTHSERLSDLVATREAFIDTISTATGGDLDLVLDLLTEVQIQAPNLGTSGEFAVGRRDGERVTFLVPLRYPVPGGSTSNVVAAEQAEPMRRALAGEIGTMVGHDYRGQRVLAAYRPVDGTDWGLVAKIDLAEVRAPIIRAGALSLAATALLVALGAILFTRITAPVLHEIAQSEARFRAIFERSQVGKSLTSPEGRLLQVNPAMAAMLGYTVAELQQLDFATVTHLDDIEDSRECVRCLLAGERETYHLEKRYLHRDGHVVWTDVNTTLLRTGDGEPQYFITTVSDVSDREQARRALLTEKNFSEAMLASLPGVAYLFDEQLTFHRWNTNFETVTGYSAHEFAALTPLELFSGPDQARVAERIAQVFSEGDAAVEADLVARDGARTPYLFTGRHVEIEGASYLIGMGVNITARKNAEEELQRHREHLEDLVSERSADLELTVERLAAANTELESFSYTVSHDLRAPLRAIDGFSRILLDEHGAELADEPRRYLQIVRDNTRQMGQLIDDLLAFSRLSRQELRTQPVALGEVVAEAWTELEPDRSDRRVELTVGDLPRVEGDARLLKLVFTNLLGNALKFTRTREVAHIEIASESRNGAAVCYVKDNGVGFDARYADKLFGVFQRLHRADQFEGTGVGLATVARIIHRHGGRVWGESEIDNGATFYLSFDGGGRGTDPSG